MGAVSPLLRKEFASYCNLADPCEAENQHLKFFKVGSIFLVHECHL